MEQYNDLLKTNGISLIELGISDIALDRNNAIRAVEILRGTELPILGGDVYFRREGETKQAYANWYANPKPNEDQRAYLSRSLETTEAYFRNFPQPPLGTEPLFALVLGKATLPDR